MDESSTTSGGCSSKTLLSVEEVAENSGGSLVKWVFENRTAELDARVYWTEAFTTPLETYLYERIGLGSFDELSCEQEGDKKLRVVSIHPKQTYVDSVLGTLSTSYEPLSYETVQHKYECVIQGCYRMSFENTFNRAWKSSIPHMTGQVEVYNDPSTGELVQRTEIQLVVNIGWNDSAQQDDGWLLWAYKKTKSTAGSTMNATATKLAYHLIHSEVGRMLDESNVYIKERGLH